MRRIVAWSLTASALCVSTVPAFSDIERLEERIKQIQANLPEVQVEQTVIQVSPQVRVYVPNGSLDLSFRQQYIKAIVDFSTKYDFVENSMGISLDTHYDLEHLTPGIALRDSVSFNEIFADQPYTQRIRSFNPYLSLPLGGHSELTTGMRFDTTYTSSADSGLTLDHGRDVVGSMALSNSTVIESTSAPRGGSRSLSVERSFDNLGSDYRYVQLEAAIRQFMYPTARDFVEWNFKFGFPVEITNRPLTSAYAVGGYRILRGYRYKEFRGDALVYGAVKYNIPLTGSSGGHIPGLSFALFTWNVFSEGAMIGSREIYNIPSEVHASMGTGLGYKVVILKVLPVQFEFSLAKAFDARDPQTYFTISTIYYTWNPR